MTTGTPKGAKAVKKASVPNETEASGPKKERRTDQELADRAEVLLRYANPAAIHKRCGSIVALNSDPRKKRDTSGLAR